MCLPPGEVYVLHAHCILIIKQRFTQKRRVLFSRARRRLPELARGSHTAPRLSPPCVPHARGGKDESLSPRNPPRCLTPTRCSAEPPAELSPAELRMSRAEEAAWGRAGGSEASRWGGGRPPGCPRSPSFISRVLGITSASGGVRAAVGSDRRTARVRTRLLSKPVPHRHRLCTPRSGASAGLAPGEGVEVECREGHGLPRGAGGHREGRRGRPSEAAAQRVPVTVMLWDRAQHGLRRVTITGER